jgi:hypothetical protein
VKGRLDQSGSGSATIAGAIHHRLHKQTANPHILYSGVNRDGANPANDGTLVKAVAPNNPAVHLCHNAIKIRV